MKLVTLREEKMKATMMKVLVGVMLVSIFAAGNLAAQTLSGGPHDLTGASIDTQVPNDLCRYCHTPHNAVDPATAGVSQLWDRTAPATASFTVYDSGTMVNTAIQPEGVSLACLSCHDGATAFDSLTGLTVTGSNTMTDIFPSSTANFGDSLLNDHPVSVALEQGSGGLETVAAVTGAGLTLYAGTNANQVECASCHDPHGDDTDFFLRIPSATGGLCETCHNK
jgi:predicted CXXCH cytochrome family protein